MKFIFISDLHLSPQTPEKNQLFYHLLKSWRGGIDGLYILGDFFDYWLGDDDDNEFISEMRHNLQQFSSVTKLYFRGGNHDFGVGKIFAAKCGMQLINDMHIIEIAKKRILLSHGDTFCTLDLSYQKMKRVLQHPIVMFILRKIPLALRYKLKEKLEKKSHAQTGSKPDYIYQVVDDSIAEHVTNFQADAVIHGHTHRPGYYSVPLGDGKIIPRYEIPDWEDNPPGGYIVAEDSQIMIHQIS